MLLTTEMHGPLRILEDGISHRIRGLVGRSAGIYLIFGYEDASLREPITIQRFLKADSSGLLYIGKATDLQRRISDAVCCISPDYADRKHSFGNRYKELSEEVAGFAERFQRQGLCVGFWQSSDLDSEARRDAA